MPGGDDQLTRWRSSGQAIRLATAVLKADKLLSDNKVQLAKLDERKAPGLIHEFGHGPVTVAWLLIAYSQQVVCVRVYGRRGAVTGFVGQYGAVPAEPTWRQDDESSRGCHC